MNVAKEGLVNVEEAIEMLEVIPDYDPGDGPKPCVHTFRGGSPFLLGAHWSLDDVRAAFQKYGVERAGENAMALGHGLAIIDETGPVFFETKHDGKVEKPPVPIREARHEIRKEN